MTTACLRSAASNAAGQITLGAPPYVGLLIIDLAIIMIWPQIALWVPSHAMNLK